MRHPNFDVPVIVTVGRSAGVSAISDVGQAADMLINRWPAAAFGTRYRYALKTCVEAMRQRRAISGARKASIGASKETNLFVRECRT